MLNYNTTIGNTPPVSADRKRQALSGLSFRSPYSYGSAHQDALNSMGSVNAERYSREADRANSDYDLAQRDAEQQLVLAGLRQMADAQQNAQSVYNTRLQNLTGFAKGLLGGLFD